MITEKAREVVNEVSKDISTETGAMADPWLVAQRIAIRSIEDGNAKDMKIMELEHRLRAVGA